MKHEEYFGGEVPFIKSGDVKADYVSSGALWLTQLALDETTAKYVPAGTVVVVTRSGILKHNLPVAITSNPVVIIMRCDSDSGKKLIKSMVLRTADRQGMC